jgi:hypothetical protein
LGLAGRRAVRRAQSRPGCDKTRRVARLPHPANPVARGVVLLGGLFLILGAVPGWLALVVAGFTCAHSEDLDCDDFLWQRIALLTSGIPVTVALAAAGASALAYFSTGKPTWLKRAGLSFGVGLVLMGLTVVSQLVIPGELET